MPSTVAMEPLLAAASPASAREAADPALSPLPAELLSAAPAETIGGPEMAPVTAVLPGASSNSGDAGSGLAAAEAADARQPVAKSLEVRPAQLAAEVAAQASIVEPAVPGSLAMKAAGTAVPPSGEALGRPMETADPALVPAQTRPTQSSQARETTRVVPPAAPPAKASAAALVGMAGAAKGFDLGSLKPPARAAKPQPSPAAARPSVRAPSDRTGSTRSRNAAAGHRRDRVEGDVIFHQAKVNLDDRPASTLSVRIGAGGDLSLRLGDLLSLYGPDMAPAVFSRLSESSAADEFVSFGTLRSAGIDIRYDAGRDQLRIYSAG